MNSYSDEKFHAQKIVAGEYDSCTFTLGDYKSLDLSKFRFTDCVFEQCDMSLARLSGTSLNNVTFINCKQLGLRFDECEKMLLSVSFKNCILNFCSFYGMKLKKTVFSECQLQETEFTGADLTQAQFTKCDLQLAVFADAILDGADFRTAFNYTIDPERSSMKKARFSLDGLPGLLTKYGIITG